MLGPDALDGLPNSLIFLFANCVKIVKYIHYFKLNYLNFNTCYLALRSSLRDGKLSGNSIVINRPTFSSMILLKGLSSLNEFLLWFTDLLLYHGAQLKTGSTPRIC